MDVTLNRAFIKYRSPFVGVKTHMQGNFPDDLVALHNFTGGYCGVSKVENGNMNICYLANYKSFQQYKNIDSFNKQVLYKNPHLKNIFENSGQPFMFLSTRMGIVGRNVIFLDMCDEVEFSVFQVADNMRLFFLGESVTIYWARWIFLRFSLSDHCTVLF